VRSRLPSIAWVILLHAVAARGQAIDTDGDGLADEVEDANHNGRWDIGETDRDLADTDGDGSSDGQERERGTDPARNPLIDFPEPMVFDLVRGLGAERGELEANVLSQVAARTATEIQWAPELEFAFAKWHALELEVGGTNAHVDALKLALQGTVRYQHRDAHGWQVLADFDPHAETLEALLLYVGALRLSPRASLVALAGPAVVADFEERAQNRTSPAGVINATLFVAASQRTTIGLEANLAFEHGLELGRIIPQWHQQIGSHFRLQLGAGYRYARAMHWAEASLRLIAEI
jgi:hypothetical protein